MDDDQLAGLIIDGCDDAVIFADAAGVIRRWNAAATRVFGHSADEAVGQSLDLIVPERFRQRHWDGYHEVMASGKTSYAGRLLAVPAVRKNGERISIEFTVTLVSEGGRVAGAAAVVRDVTERRAEEQALRQRIAALEAPASS